ncbi:MAG: UvrB/UvrC motif-containing protein [Verrucomicrobiota bacterium]|nr:UvrB/UvrC motif-containing protein [Verrucomicrobiota bacterium]
MKCDLCKTNEATVHVEQVCEGSVQELSLCADCAGQKGLSGASPLSLTNLLFGAVAPSELSNGVRNRKCRACGLRLSEFKKGARMGCAQCYETFAEELQSVLAGMHPGRQHVGKAPVGERANSEIAQIQGALAQAIAAQNFEEAARLRDRIGAMKNAAGKETSHDG